MSSTVSQDNDRPPIANALSPEALIDLAIRRLPALTPDKIPLEDSCPICLQGFRTLVNEKPEDVQYDDEELLAIVGDSAQLRGVTRLEGCGHFFCRRDLIEWITGRHGTCPSCRHTFLDIKPYSETDDESSDGGEYLPPSDDTEEDEDDFFDGADDYDDEDEFDDDDLDMGREDSDFEVDQLSEDMSLEPVSDVDDEGGVAHEDNDEENLGLTDTETSSDGGELVSGESESSTREAEVATVEEGNLNTEAADSTDAKSK